MWNEQQKEWPQRSAPGTSWLNFQIPRELLPLVVSKARIEIKSTGPIGRIEILGLNAGQVKSQKVVIDPVGSSVFEIDDPNVLNVATDGGLVLGLSAGDPSRPELTNTKSAPVGATADGAAPAAKLDPNAKVNYWQIESLTLQLWAKTTEPQ